MVKLGLHIESRDLKQPFRITGREWRSTRALVVELIDDDHRGRGESHGVPWLGETPESLAEQVEGVAGKLRRGLSREDLQHCLPAGGARNAIDCALWELDAKRRGRTVFELAGVGRRAVTTAFTIGLEGAPEAMAEKAAAAAGYPLLKVKLDADRPLERLRAIRQARPDARLICDANQGWTPELLRSILPDCAKLGLRLIEQPLPVGEDAALEGLESPVPLAADESCNDRQDLDRVAAYYDVINIKLDKTGGLTEALALAHAAKEKGCGLMVGNMLGSSLAMAPSFLVAQLCEFVDIDGPLLLKYDHPDGLIYEGATVHPPRPQFWG